MELGPDQWVVESQPEPGTLIRVGIVPLDSQQAGGGVRKFLVAEMEKFFFGGGSGEAARVCRPERLREEPQKTAKRNLKGEAGEMSSRKKAQKAQK